MISSAIIKENSSKPAGMETGDKAVNKRAMYTVTLNGTAYLVEVVEYAQENTPQQPQCREGYANGDGGVVRQASWVTARRTAHLPAR